MALEQTFILIKPDGVEKGLTNHIVETFENNGLFVSELHTIEKLDTAKIEEHYAHIIDKVVNGNRIFPGVQEYMQRGPVVCAIVSGEDAITKVMELTGVTSPAKCVDGQIRKLGEGHENIIHRTDIGDFKNGINAAQVEINRFMPQNIIDAENNRLQLMKGAQATDNLDKMKLLISVFNLEKSNPLDNADENLADEIFELGEEILAFKAQTQKPAMSTVETILSNIEETIKKVPEAKQFIASYIENNARQEVKDIMKGTKEETVTQ
jgi:nucleoside-diphosphate kinase